MSAAELYYAHGLHERRFQPLLQRIRTDSVEVACLGKWYLGAFHAKQVAEALDGNRFLRSLHMGGNWITDLGALALAEALQSSSLTGIDLSNNGIGPTGAVAVASSLKRSAVTRLDLQGNQVGDLGAIALAEMLHVKSLASLGLCNSGIGEEGVKALAGALRASCVSELRLGANPIGDDGIKALAAGIKDSKLAWLDLESCHLDQAGAMALALVLKDSDIETLWLQGNSLREEGGKALLAGVAGTAVCELRLKGDDSCSEETHMRLKLAVEANKTRCVVLQMQVEGERPCWRLTFRSVGGDVAAVLPWSSDRAKDLPSAVLQAIKASGFFPKDRHLRARNLKIVSRDGEILNCRGSASLAQQLLGKNST